MSLFIRLAFYLPVKQVIGLKCHEKVIFFCGFLVSFPQNQLIKYVLLCDIHLLGVWGVVLVGEIRQIFISIIHTGWPYIQMCKGKSWFDQLSWKSVLLALFVLTQKWHIWFLILWSLEGCPSQVPLTYLFNKLLSLSLYFLGSHWYLWSLFIFSTHIIDLFEIGYPFFVIRT